MRMIFIQLCVANTLVRARLKPKSCLFKVSICHALGFMCLSISIVVCFLKEQLSRCHAKYLLRKKRIRVDSMPNLLLMEINRLRSRCHALRLTNIKYHVMIVVLCTL